MNERLFSTLWAGLLVLMLSVALTACDSQNAVEDEGDTTAQEAAELTSTLAQNLSLSASQQQALQNTVDRNQHRMHEPGFLWYVAADLQANLTEEQKERLFALAEQREGRLGGPGGFGPGGFGPGDGTGALFNDLLDDTQKAAVEEIRARYRTQIEALVTSRRNGDITPEAFREQMQALHDAMRAEIEALLTDEQKAEIEQRREEREAEREAERAAYREQERAAMIEVLGLTTEQVDALDALFETQQADRDALFEQFQNGVLSREDLQTALVDLKEAGDDAFKAILDDETKWEIKLIHDALAAGFGHRGGQGRPGGPGQGGPGQGGPGQGGPGQGGPGQGGPGQGRPGHGGPGHGGPGHGGPGSGGNSGG